MSVSELIYDWNTVEPQLHKPERHIGFDDETLRDGLQSPSVCEPSVEKKIELLHLMDALGIDTADIGLPGAGGTHAAGVELMAREIADQKMKIRPNDRGDFTAGRDSDRSLHFHRLITYSLFCRRMDAGQALALNRGGRHLRRQ